MTFKISDDRFRELLQIEEELNCDIGAGYAGIYLDEFLSDPAGFQQVRQLQAIVLAEFKALLEELNLGIGKDAAFVCGQRLVIDRLANPPGEIQEQLRMLSQEKVTVLEPIQSRQFKLEVQTIIRNSLTQEDWIQIAGAAAESVRNQVLAHPQQRAKAS